MNTRVHSIAAALITSAALLTACKKDKDDDHQHDHDHEQELITTVQLRFLPSVGSEQKQFIWRDADGDGGNPPVITADTLAAGIIYAVGIEVLNESVSPADTITAEIRNEAAAHQFFFQVTGANAAVAYADSDGNGNPVGLASTWTIGTASAGTVKVTLRHQPNKGAPGVSAGNITNAGGDTDIEVVFPLVIE